MEKIKRPGAKAGAMEGKGFYIVLLLCAAVIGVSAWILLASSGTNVEDSDSIETIVEIPAAVVTMVPAGSTPVPAETAPAQDTIAVSSEAVEEQQSAPAEDTFGEAVTSYVWPVRGAIETPYAVDALVYDPTMADWRTHSGIDVASPLGTEVLAAAAGTVVGVNDDDLLGTMVEIDHANGVHTVYANLAPEPPVAAGQSVSMGQVIGSVGNTALGETNQVAHLHFAMMLDGRAANPMDYLPELPAEE